MSPEQQNGWRQLLMLCHRSQNEAQLDALFELLLTLDEKEQLATRVLLIKELLAGNKPQRQIASDLKLSIAKITRGSNALKTIAEQLKQFLTQHLL